MTTNNTRRSTSIMVALLLCLISNSYSLSASFSISKTYLKTGYKQPSIISLGRIKIFEQGQMNQAYIESNEPILVTGEEVKKYKTVILIFKNEQTGKQFRSAINTILPQQHSEKIVAVLSSSEEVIGFNYLQTRVPNQDISVQIQQPERGVDHVFKVETQQKQVAPEESFFSKYKWPIIIGIALLYMTMNGAADKPGGQAQPAQQ